MPRAEYYRRKYQSYIGIHLASYEMGSTHQDTLLKNRPTRFQQGDFMERYVVRRLEEEGFS